MDAPITRAELNALTERIEDLYRKFDAGNSSTTSFPEVNVSETSFAEPQENISSGAEEIITMEESQDGHEQGICLNIANFVFLKKCKPRH